MRLSRSRIALAVFVVLAGAGGLVWCWTWRPLPAAAAWPAGALAGGNLLLVTFDTVRADRLSAEAMPRLHALAAASHQFSRAYAATPLTLPSHASILTGLRPPVHGVAGNGAFRLDEGARTLAERLQDAGYRTGAFVGAFVLDSRFGLAQGFDVYEGVDDPRAFAADFGFAERRAPDVLAGAARWVLEGADARPWFAWVHLFDAHAPYAAPESAGLTPYDDEVHYADAALGALLDRLTAARQLERTLILVTADHGEGLGEHGESTHGLFVYDSTMRVPLVVSGPGLGAGLHPELASHIDLVPTVLDVLGLPADPALPGRSLGTQAREPGHPASGEGVYLEALDGWLTAGAAPVTALVGDGMKFIDVPEPELYDLTADPGETQNLYLAAPERAGALADALRPLAERRAPPAGAVPDARAEARLRSLGYASGGARQPGGTFTAADDPKRLLPLYERFLAVLARGGGDAAALEALVRERPAFEAARLAAASVLIDTDRASEAIALLEEGDPSPSQAAVERLGSAYLAAGKAVEAAAAFERAVASPRASADAWNGLGVARAQAGRHSEAREAFDRALALAPDAAGIRMNRALALLDAGDRAGAESEAAVVTARHPGLPDGWRLLGTLRHGRGDRAGAVDAWRRVLALDDADLDTLYNLAVTLNDLGRAAEARDAAARFIARAPRDRYAAEIAALAPLTRP